MTSSLELVSIQYALALLVGKDLDLRVMLRKFLPPALRLLNCRSGHIWLPQCPCQATAESDFSLCYSYPSLRVSLNHKLPAVAARLQQIAAAGGRLEDSFEILHEDGTCCHFLPIGSSGLLMLVRDQELSQAELLALQPVLERLENACLACIQHAYVEQARNEALQAKEAAEQANKAKSDFLAMISHELRTPMNSVIGLTDLMLYSNASPPQREYLGMIKSSANALLDIINEILDFSRIEAGALSLCNTPFHLGKLLRDTFTPLAVQAREKALAFYWETEPGIPEILEGDAGRLRQVLINLIGNAIKFTQSGEVRISVTQQPVTDEGYICLQFAVLDTGIGIPSGKLASIFQPFEQVNTSVSRRYGGTGLGLAISTQLVRMMGGSLQVDSTPGKGSRFYFSLPYKLLMETAVPVAAPSQLKAASRPLNILLAEDNELNSLFITLLLDKAGHTTTVVENGRAAIDAWLQNRPDVILMDVQMPEMDGLEATRLIRQHEQANGGHTPIIALTANAMNSDREQCLASGMDDFLSKPFDAQYLLALLEQVGAGRG